LQRSKLCLSMALVGAYCTASAADGRTAEYGLNRPVERAQTQKECSLQATTRDSPECLAAGRAAAAALGRGKPVYIGAPTEPATAVPSSPSDRECTIEALKAIQNKDAREDMASACIRRGTFKPTKPTRTF
jgi:entry exclusion lipoprotein TrbK